MTRDAEDTRMIRDLHRVGDVVAARLAEGSADVELGVLNLRLTLARSEISADRVADAIVRSVEGRAQ